jgi:NADPH:quinone reductase-like Zn-dependent oxidoreductase
VAESTSFEDAATLPLAVMTAAIGLFRRLGLQEPPASGVGKADGIVIVNGASSSVGCFIVQLAKRAGYTVVGIAGDSEELAKSLGADYIVNYRNKSSQELGQAVRDAVAKTGKKIVGVYDAVSTDATVEMLAYEVLAKEGGGKITTVLPAHDNGEGLTVSNVQVERTMVSGILPFLPSSSTG